MKTLLSIVLVSLALVGCKRAGPYDPNVYATAEELAAQQEKCESLNGTLVGYRQDRGPRMGEWYDLSCDFNQPPTKNAHSTNEVETTESTTVFE